MVYMMSSTRAGRPTKEKAKSNHTSKSDGPSHASMNHKPTPEQIRLASSMRTTDDPEMEEKIQQLAELTGKSKDEACIALHDCDYDLDRAVEKLFESEVQGEWQEMKTKKKKNQPTSKSEVEQVTEEEPTIDIPEKGFEKEYNNDRNYERSGSAPRGRRNDRAPPRFQKAGRGRNINDDDRGDSQSRDRGRGRGRGNSRGRGRGRGGGGGGPRKNDFGGNNNNRDRAMNYDNGPGMSIDTWSNDVAEEPKKESSFGTWGEMATEDWTGDEWQGTLDKTTVFTSSVNNEASKVFSDNDAKMFSVTSIETQAFNNTLSNSMPSPPQLDSYQHTNQPMPDPIQQLTAQKPIGQNAVGQGAIGQPSVMGQSSAMGQGSGSMSQNSIGQRLDLGILLSGKSPEYKQPDSVEAVTQQTAELTKETADFMAQFQKQATETIKSVVGIGSSSSQSSAPIGGSSLSAPQQPPVAPQQQPPPASVQQPLASETVPVTSATPAIQPAQPKAQRPLRSTTKLPPPSKIPASAVVMPGAGKFGASVDVEFGCFSESPGGFSFGSISGVTATTESNTYSSSGVTASLGNHLSQVNKSEPQPSVMTSATNSVTSQQQSVSSILESMTQQNSQSPRPSVAYTPTTPPKNYSQSSKISSPPEPIPFPDRKSPYQPPGSTHTQSEQPANVPLNNYSQSSYSTSAYPSSAYKAVPTPAISSAPSGVGSNFSASHGSSSLSSGGSSLSSSNPLQNYQSSSFQSQQQVTAQSGASSGGTGYTGGSTGNSATANSLYQSSSNPPSSSFQGQNTASYSTGANQSQNSSYSGNQSSVGSVSGGSTGVGAYQQSNSYLTRDSQSAPAFQSSVSSGGSSSTSAAYQGSSTTSNQSSSSAYQRDPSSQSSGSAASVGGQSGGYGQVAGSTQSAYNSVGVSVGQQQQQQTPSASSLSSTSKSLNDSLSKLTVKDNSATSLVDGQLGQSVTGQYDSSSVSSAAVVAGGSSVGVANLHTSTNSTSSSIAAGSVTMSSGVSLGITNTSVLSAANSAVTNTTSSATSVSVSKSAFPVTTKAPVNLPPGMPPLIGHGQTNYMIGQHGFPIAFGLQQPLYSYEDLMHQRLPLHTATTLTGIDQSKLAAAAAANYSAADASKMNRVEAQSPVNAQQSSQPTQQQTTPQTAQQTAQQQQQQQTATQQQTQQSATHGQATAFPHMAPNQAPGLAGYYNYYMGGLHQHPYPYQTQLIPFNNLLPAVTNTGVTSANAQFQKTAYNYGSAASYDSLTGGSHDFSKAFGVGVTQSQNKVSAASMSVSSSSDLSSYQKQTGFDKSGFTGGTPPPFSNLPPGLPTGTQTGQGQLGGGTPFMQAQYMPQALAAAAAHPNPMLHQLHQTQDTSGGSGRAGQQSSNQAKSLMGNKPSNYSGGYWGGN